MRLLIGIEMIDFLQGLLGCSIQRGALIALQQNLFFPPEEIIIILYSNYDAQLPLSKVTWVQDWWNML